MVTIKFKTDNAAYRFSDGTLDIDAVSESIKDVALKVYQGNKDGIVVDVNGNVVGTYKVR